MTCSHSYSLTSLPLPNESKRNPPYYRSLWKNWWGDGPFTETCSCKLNEHLSAMRNLPQRSPPRYSGFQLTNWISETLNCARLRYRCFSYLFSLEKHNLVCSIWITYLLGRDLTPLLIALVFSNAGSGYISVEVNLNKIPHESLLLIFQRHRAQIRAFRIQLSDDDSMCRQWDRLAPYSSPQNGQTSQSCGCVHWITGRFLVWCFRYPE